MTSRVPMFERVDGVVECNLVLGDLVYADHPEINQPSLWVRIEQWQTTLNGDVVIHGTIDQPTDTIPAGFHYGNRVQVYASRVFDHIPAERVVDERIKSFYRDDGFAVPPPDAPEDVDQMTMPQLFQALHERIDILNGAISRMGHGIDRLQAKMELLVGDGK